MNLLPVELAHQLATVPEERRWLIEGLWMVDSVGIVGGEPKSFKSTCAADLAVAVASGAPCLGRFRTAQTGRVLLFPAEDALHVVRSRLEGIAAHRGVDLSACDIHVITAPIVRIDLEADRQRLDHTVAALKPTLLILDPFVRMHRADENSCAEIAPLLAYLRELQRRHHVAVVLVHHSRKGGANMRAGQALRGSSEFHGWTDCALYLRRTTGDQLTLTVEHRAAPSESGILLALRTDANGVALAVVDQPTGLTALPNSASNTDVTATIQRVLADTKDPIAFAALRSACHIRKASLYRILADLAADGRIIKSAAGYQLASR